MVDPVGASDAAVVSEVIVVVAHGVGLDGVGDSECLAVGRIGKELIDAEGVDTRRGKTELLSGALLLSQGHSLDLAE